MMLMIRAVLPFVVVAWMLYVAGAQPVASPVGPNNPCYAEITAFAQDCILSNILACGTSCIGQNVDLGNSPCERTDELCQAVTCCAECAEAGKAAATCALNDAGCDRNCDNFAPVAPTPTAPTPTAPVAPCAAESAPFALCLLQNLVDCGLSCAALGVSGDGGLENVCTDPTASCQALTCCPACLAEGKVAVNCLLASEGCDGNCDDVAPVAPTPTAPTPPTAPTTIIPGIPTSGCGQDAAAYAICLAENILDCGLECANTAGSLDDVCLDPTATCQTVTCCPACLEAGKAAVTCLLESEGCGGNCDDVAPVAPTPTAPTPLLEPSCIADGTSFTVCLSRNVFDCASACDSVAALDDTICADPVASCQAVTCCPACAELGKSTLSCVAGIEGCTINCDDVAPVASIPTVPTMTGSGAPVTLAPAAAPVTGTGAPFTLAPAAAPVTGTGAPFTLAPAGPGTGAPFTVAPISAPGTGAPITTGPVAGNPVLTLAPVFAAPTEPPATPTSGVTTPVHVMTVTLVGIMMVFGVAF